MSQMAIDPFHPTEDFGWLHLTSPPRNKPLTLPGSRMARTNQRRARSGRDPHIRVPGESCHHRRLALLDRAVKHDLLDGSSALQEKELEEPPQVVGYSQDAQEFLADRFLEEEEELEREIISTGLVADARLCRLGRCPSYFEAETEALAAEPEIKDHWTAVLLEEYEHQLACAAA